MTWRRPARAFRIESDGDLEVASDDLAQHITFDCTELRLEAPTTENQPPRIVGYGTFITISRAELFEVSMTAHPAFVDTEITLRADDLQTCKIPMALLRLRTEHLSLAV